jgi:hypothetical protein
MKQISTSLLIYIAVFASSFAGSPSEVLPQKQDGNFTLHVTNQSFDLSPVDITILIDGKKAASSDFHVKDQHHWVTHKFKLSEGKHSIQALSTKGDSVFKQDFEVKGKTWGLLSFWLYSDKNDGKGAFRLMIHYNPIGISYSPTSRSSQFLSRSALQS